MPVSSFKVHEESEAALKRRLPAFYKRLLTARAHVIAIQTAKWMSDRRSPSIIRACAIMADAAVPYRRAGRGHPVLLLAATAALATAALQDAPRELCVIVPDVLPSAPAFIAWFALFLDTLGIQSASIVALESLAGFAREFAAMEPDRVRRVLSIGDGESTLAVADALRNIADFTIADAPSKL